MGYAESKASEPKINPIKVGDSLPQDIIVQEARTFDDAVANQFAGTKMGEVLSSGKVVVFNMPGPFTGVCENGHVPNVMKSVPKMNDEGYEVVITSATDCFSMNGWRKAMATNTDGTKWYADCSGELAKTLGTDCDLSGIGVHGPRATRYCAAFVKGKLDYIAVEADPTHLDKATSEKFLENLEMKE